MSAVIFARREHRFYTAKVNNRSIWSYQIDGTLGPKFELTVFYTRPLVRSISLGRFDRIEDAKQRAESHFHQVEATA